MSGKNRNMRHLPTNNLLLNYPLPDENPDDNHYFGEVLSKRNLLFDDNLKCDTTNDSLDSILNSIHDLNTDKSSSSTVSWGVGDDNETTTILKNELKRIEDILTGQLPIPDDCDTEEYNKWLKYFPRFCIVGKSLEHPVKNNNNCDYFEEIIAIHPDKYQDQVTIENSTIPWDLIKETLIDQIYNKLSKLLINTESFPVTKKPVEIPVNSQIIVDDYLKISPISSSALLPQRHRIRRGHSSKSLVSSQISSAKWLKDDTNEYTSLPFLADNLIKDDCKLFIRKSREEINMPKSILKARLVLPPIDQFRSISATPRAAFNKYSSNLLSINGERTKLENDRCSGKRISARRKINRRLERNKSCEDN